MLESFVPPESITQLAAKGQEGKTVAAQLQALPCETPDQEQFFANCLTMVRDVVKTLEEERTKLTGPLHQVKTRIDTLFRNTRQGWESAEQVIRAKLQAAAQVRLDAQREAQRLAAEAAAANQPALAVQALAAAPQHGAPVGTSNAEQWIVESWDETQMPREWMSPAWDRLNKYLHDHAKSQTIPPIPGVKFKRVAKVVARG